MTQADTLADYERLTSELEAGRVPAGFTTLAEAARTLCYRLHESHCWTPLERQRANRLEVRLAKVIHGRRCG